MSRVHVDWHGEATCGARLHVGDFLVDDPEDANCRECPEVGFLALVEASVHQGTLVRVGWDDEEGPIYEKVKDHLPDEGFRAEADRIRAAILRAGGIENWFRQEGMDR